MIILGIDFNNMVYGSAYSSPLYNSYGQNVNAIKGFFMKFQTLYENINPDYVLFANDLSRVNTFRRKLYPEYKSQRKPTNEDIIFQIQKTSILVSALGFKFLNNQLYEADDILGMVSKWCVDNGHQMIIVSTDKDLYQLINQNVQIYSFVKHEMITEEYLEEHYKLKPSQWIELKMIQGDASDNLSGIKGVGQVTALKLMQEFGSINEVYKNLNNFKNGLRDKLILGESCLPLMRELVTIVTDYTKINFDLKQLERKAPDYQVISNAIYHLQIPTLVGIFNNLMMDFERKNQCL